MIAVVTSDSLNHADEIFDFFLKQGIKRLGFNVEELEGDHLTSSLVGRGREAAIRKFWGRLYQRQKECQGEIEIREFERANAAIVDGPKAVTPELSLRKGSQNGAFGIVSMDWQGNLGSFSPELLGLKSLRYNDFAFGSVHQGELLDIRQSEKFKKVARDIYEGVTNCARSCDYFDLCGGGAPSNKYFENGAFTTTETMYCRTSIQMPVDIVLADLEAQLKIVGLS